MGQLFISERSGRFLFTSLSVLVVCVLCNVLTSEFAIVGMQSCLVLFIIFRACIEKGLSKPYLFFFVSLSFFKVVLGIILYAKGYIFSDSLHYIEKITVFQAQTHFNFSTLIASAGSLHFFYELVNYTVYVAFGETFYSLILLNICLAGLGILNFYEIVKGEFGKRIATGFLLLSSFSINITIFSGWIFKEALVMYLSSLITIAWQNFKKSEHTVDLIIYFLVLLPILATRIYAGLSALSFFLYYLAVKLNCGQNFFRILKVICFCLLFLFFIPYDYIFFVQKSVSGLSPFQLLINTLKQLVKILFSPKPTNPLSLFPYYQVLIFDSIILYCLSFFILRFFHIVWRNPSVRRRVYIFVFPIIIYALALASQYDDAGLRQKMPIMPLVYATISIGMFYKKKKTEIQVL